MSLIPLPIILNVIINIMAWAFFHIAISVICFKLPLDFFMKDSAWSRLFVWEKSGKVWQQLFKVKKWKGRLIDGTVLFKKGYNKKKLHGISLKELKVFAAETKRAELTHWLSIVPAPLFFLWNPFWAGWVMAAYALLFNIPFIIVQRYNRGRITTIIGDQ